MKTVLVTGASSGIGKAIYEGYRKLKGYRVIGVSKNGPDMIEDFNSLESAGSIKETLTRNNINRIDILVNCAGFMDLNEADDYHIWESLWKVNFVTPYQLIQEFVQVGMVIINIASVSGMVADPDTPVYGATKAALISLTSSMARKYAHIFVRVNSISPGFYDTNLVVEPTPQELLDTVPLGKREEDPSKMFGVVRFIEQTEYMTGANIVVDGGLTCKI